MPDHRAIGRIELERVARVRRQVQSLPEIRFETETSGGLGRVKNVSPRGMFVLADNVPLVKESVHLVFQDDASVWIDLIGVIRWTRRDETEAGTPGFGLELEAVPREYEAYVRRLVAAVKDD